MHKSYLRSGISSNLRHAACSVLTSLALVAGLAGHAWAATPTTLGYQGFLTSPGGTAITSGTIGMTFKLYTAATGGTAIWTEVQPSVAITRGSYSVVLGSVTPLTGLAFDQQYFLGVAVGSDAEMAPRQQLTSVPYANTAKTATALATTPTTCPAGQFAQGIAANGNAACAGAASGTVTSVATGTGLSGGPITGTGTIALAHGDYADLDSAQTLTGLKNFNPASGTVPFTVDATKTGQVNNLKAQYAAQADTATTAATATTATTATVANSLSASALAQYGISATLPLPARTNTITTVDSVGYVGQYTSITLGADGLPVISYFDSSNADLKVTKCGNAACNAGNTITTVDSVGNVGQFSSITLGADGLPVISYYDTTNFDLKVAKCGDAACSAGNTFATVDSVGDVGRFTSITLGADGLPVISYFDQTNYDLKVAKCSNAACSAGNTITTVDSAGWVGYYTSITLGADGLPVISYYDYTNGHLKMAKCGDAACSAGNTITTIDSLGLVGDYNSITLGADGLPVMSYWDNTNSDLKVAKCGNAACNAGNTITTVDSTGWVGLHTSITLGADGLPVISYWDNTNGDLKVVKCGNAACSAGNTFATVDSAGNVGLYTSITLGADGLPVISYYDTTNWDLKVAKCANASCTNYAGRR